MTEKTKAVNLTEDEIKCLIVNHGVGFAHEDSHEAALDRINYLHKRLKAFKEPETETEKQNTKADNVTQGWGNP